MVTKRTTKCFVTIFLSYLGIFQTFQHIKPLMSGRIPANRATDEFVLKYLT